MDGNILLRTDSYKHSHHGFYPPGTRYIYSYLEARGGQFDSLLFFGLQYIMKKYLVGQVVTQQKIDEADEFVTAHMGPGVFNRTGWEYIKDAHNGKLPVGIKAVAEGTVLPVRNVLLTIENTDPACPWLTSFLETLLVQVWYPCTVATLSYELRKMMAHFLVATGDPSLLDFKVHDFGFRGVSSVESAGIGGMGHLVSFKGTDTMEALSMARDYYHEAMAGFSIPATEHSTMCAWTEACEADACENVLDTYPEGLVACVSDQYDIYNCCRNIWGGRLKDKVMNRNGTLVVRPDSGDPVAVVTEVIKILMQQFGFTVNAKGYRVLDPHVRVIWGDGVDYAKMLAVLEALEALKISADNITFGIGGGLLQRLHRDVQGIAMKCSSAVVRKERRDVYKRPITSQYKTSKPGRFKLVKIDGQYKTVQESDEGENLLKTVFFEGNLVKDFTFREVRNNAWGT